ncbi:PLP-dependent transferase [Macrococcus equi]|uniref:PLP-dependent transferase n=1 Tax=Macrococcus equi TaxID=3395462 RepID=UPI0039BDAD0A
MKSTQLAQISTSHDYTGATSNPIYLATAFQHEAVGHSTGFDYSRTKNPTRLHFEDAFARLEGGIASFATSSGMASIQLILNLFKPHDEILVSFDLYGGSYRLFDFYEQQYQLKFTYIDFNDLERVRASINEYTRALFIEPISNPQMQSVALEPIYEIAQEFRLLTIIDNTFLTPYLSTPLEDGADIVLHSATKYISGHNDVLAGVVTVKDETLAVQLGQFHNMIGATLSPFDSYLLARGLKTLHLRMDRSIDNAKRLSQVLNENEAIDDVLYAGTTGMLSVRLNKAYNTREFLKHLEVCIFAESLGGTETFITFPYTQTHIDMPDEEKEKRGINEQLIRISVGVEDFEDINADILQALTKSKAVEVIV